MCFQRETMASKNCQKLLNFFHAYLNSVDVWDGCIWYFTSTLFTFKISVEFQKTHDLWTVLVHPIATNKTFDRVESKAFIAHTTRKFTYLSWFRGITGTYHIFVLPTFLCRPFDSKLVFQTRNFSNNSSSVSAIKTRSSA